MRVAIVCWLEARVSGSSRWYVEENVNKVWYRPNSVIRSCDTEHSNISIYAFSEFTPCEVIGHVPKQGKCSLFKGIDPLLLALDIVLADYTRID